MYFAIELIGIHNAFLCPVKNFYYHEQLDKGMV
jgi:hypothetical protein